MNKGVEFRLRLEFDVSELDEARAILAPLDTASNEKVLLGVIQLSGGSLARLRYLSARALRYPMDILAIVSLGSASPETLHKVEDALLGGPMGVPLYPELIRKESDDLWMKNSSGLVCLVCDELLSADFFDPDPFVAVSLATPDGELEAAVHPGCVERGGRLAKQQGYIWEELGRRVDSSGRERQRPTSDDLWAKTFFQIVCVVCDKVVSADIRSNPHVRLRRTLSGAEEERVVTAHEACMPIGRRRAAEQGYGWEAVADVRVVVGTPDGASPIEAQLLETFDQARLDEARRIVSSLEVLAREPAYEVIVVGVILFSSGNLDRLRYYAERARSDPAEIWTIGKRLLYEAFPELWEEEGVGEWNRFTEAFRKGGAS